MALINIDKPTTTFSNSTKINIGETWDSITSTWATESRTWDDMASIIDNISRVFGGQLWAFNNFPWQMTAPWIDSGNITNVAKP